MAFPYDFLVGYRHGLSISELEIVNRISLFLKTLHGVVRNYGSLISKYNTCPTQYCF